MLKIICRENLLADEAIKKYDLNAIVHGVNAFNTWGAGIALQIKKIYPVAYEADGQTIKGDRSKLGKFTQTFIKEKNLWIGNLYTQYTFYDINDMFYLHAFFDAMRVFVLAHEECEEFNVGLPGIGCGLANASPEDIFLSLLMLDKLFASMKLKVNFHLFLINEPLIALFQGFEQKYCP